MFVARKSNHIEEDIKRNWSSWNFGEAGFEGTRNELNDYLNSATDENPVFISGFDIYPDNVKEFTFGELYNNYFVAIDNINTPNGLSCIELEANTIEGAITEASERSDYWGDGQSFDARQAKLVYSNDDIHVFEIL